MIPMFFTLSTRDLALVLLHVAQRHLCMRILKQRSHVRNPEGLASICFDEISAIFAGISF